jgi:Uma2 family endonuclease
MAIDTRVHRISTAEYTRMVDSGALEEMRVELLDGLLVDMTPQGHEHARIIQALMVLFAPRVDLLHVQMPVELEDGWVPEPDIALAIRPGGRHPTTACLVAEVAASGLPIALRKATAYARANVDRYWIIDVEDGRVLEHTEPGPDGYRVTTVLTGDDALDARVEGLPATTVAALLS